MGNWAIKGWAGGQKWGGQWVKEGWGGVGSGQKVGWAGGQKVGWTGEQKCKRVGKWARGGGQVGNATPPFSPLTGL